jgi:hypothetical protein
MARTIKDALLDSRTARSRLKARGKPYWRGLEPGLHLGFRRPATGAGKWLARHYVGDQKYEVETIGVADDFSDPDGVAILSFPQAQTLARTRIAHTLRPARPSRSPSRMRSTRTSNFWSPIGSPAGKGGTPQMLLSCRRLAGSRSLP